MKIPGWILKTVFNCYPTYRATGGRFVFITPDWKKARVKLPLNLWTRNYVGTIFGGSIYSAVDPVYMVMLIKTLGKEYVVWDKSAKVEFLRPGKETLFSDFELTDEILDEIRAEVVEKNEFVRTFEVFLQTKEGERCARVEKHIYIASKEFYKQKQRKRAERASAEGGV